VRFRRPPAWWGPARALPEAQALTGAAWVWHLAVTHAEAQLLRAVVTSSTTAGRLCGC